MNLKKKGIPTLLLTTSLLLSLSGAAFAATSTTAPVKEAEEVSSVISVAPEAEPEEKIEAVHVQPGETVYNNGETIYNDGGTIYNNGGVVYNNGGVTFNNRGIIYNNGGIVYNNGGTVYDNGGDIFNNNGEVMDALRAGYNRITFAGDYSDSVTMKGLETDENGTLWLPEENVLTITPNEGLAIRSAETGDADWVIGENGVLIVTNVTAAEKITLNLCPQAPEISLASGTYSNKQTVSIAASNGTVYYTTDGTEPAAETGTPYTGPVTVSNGIILKAVAVQSGLGTSEAATEQYAFVDVSGPAFKDEKTGYSGVEPQGILMENRGETDAVIEKVEITEDKDRAFRLSTTAGGTVTAGATDDSTWTLTPVTGLSAGKYSARLVVTLNSGETENLVVTFTVTA